MVVPNDLRHQHARQDAPVLPPASCEANGRARRRALATASIYSIIAALTIIASNLAVSGLTGSAYTHLLADLAFGLVFVGITGTLLYVIASRMMAAAAERERHLSQALAQSYESTLTGWARALDMRDHETEGHSARVTELAVRLATSMGVCGEELEHIRRGAMLHDIGKIGVPDAILHKPGPLVDEEWAVMRRHPELAYDMLEPIEFLRPVLAIPYCHHERWDGSGYPRGLAGEEIPLAARIFAVVDVWDALVSDRPYRGAWPHKKAAAYLNAHAGNLFDPQVVRAFLAMLDAEREPRELPTAQQRRKVA